MKLTESTLRRIIKEELQKVLNQDEKETYKVILDYHGELEGTFSSKQEAIDAADTHNATAGPKDEALYVVRVENGAVYDLNGYRRN